MVRGNSFSIRLVSSSQPLQGGKSWDSHRFFLLIQTGKWLVWGVSFNTYQVFWVLQGPGSLIKKGTLTQEQPKAWRSHLRRIQGSLLMVWMMVEGFQWQEHKSKLPVDILLSGWMMVERIPVARTLIKRYQIIVGQSRVFLTISKGWMHFLRGKLTGGLS